MDQLVESLQSCAQVRSCAPSDEHSRCKAAVDKGWEKLEKLPAWQMTKCKKEVILEAQKEQRTVQFGTLMDICHLKNAELEPKLQKWQGRVVLRGDIVKDGSGAYAVFTEQGSSASHMTAAKVMDVFARQPDCDGHAADAVSVYTQVKNRRRSEIDENSKARMSRHMDTSSTTNGPNRGQTLKNQLFLWTEICMVTSPTCRITVGKTIWKSSFEVA